MIPLEQVESTVLVQWGRVRFAILCGCGDRIMMGESDGQDQHSYRRESAALAWETQGMVGRKQLEVAGVVRWLK